MYKSLTEIKRQKFAEVSDLFDNMRHKSPSASAEAGKALLARAAEYGLGVKDYLNLAIEPEGDAMGIDLVLSKLNLPVKNSIRDGITLQAASETFQTYSGTRALFPEVIDQVLRWKNRQDQFETLAPLVMGTRTISGHEVLSTVVEDDSADRSTYIVPEGGRIPVRAIRTSQSTVPIFKYGSAIRTTYEFNRRASLDLITPYLARLEREKELQKVRAATAMLVGGDTVHAAATEVNQSSFNTYAGTPTAGQISWKHLLYWMVTRAKAGVPIDTVAMNWDGWFQWQMLFAQPQVIANGLDTTGSDSLSRAGVSLGQTAVSLALRVTPVLSSDVPAGKLIGFTKMETLEELVEANSQIEETMRAIENQTISVFRTENVGFRLAWGDTRQIYDYSE